MVFAAHFISVSLSSWPSPATYACIWFTQMSLPEEDHYDDEQHTSSSSPSSITATAPAVYSSAYYDDTQQRHITQRLPVALYTWFRSLRVIRVTARGRDEQVPTQSSQLLAVIRNNIASLQQLQLTTTNGNFTPRLFTYDIAGQLLMCPQLRTYVSLLFLRCVLLHQLPFMGHCCYRRIDIISSERDD